jgi:hypothetical protein
MPITWWMPTLIVTAIVVSAVLHFMAVRANRRDTAETDLPPEIIGGRLAEVTMARHWKGMAEGSSDELKIALAESTRLTQELTDARIENARIDQHRLELVAQVGDLNTKVEKLNADSKGRAALADSRRRLKEIEDGMRREEKEIRDALVKLIIDYLKMLRRWPNEQPILEPFILQWRPAVGDTQYGRHIETVMQWTERVRAWSITASNRIEGIETVDIVAAVSNHNHLNDPPLGAMAGLFLALMHVDMQIDITEMRRQCT